MQTIVFVASGPTVTLAAIGTQAVVFAAAEDTDGCDAITVALTTGGSDVIWGLVLGCVVDVSIDAAAVTGGLVFVSAVISTGGSDVIGSATVAPVLGVSSFVTKSENMSTLVAFHVESCLVLCYHVVVFSDREERAGLCFSCIKMMYLFIFHALIPILFLFLLMSGIGCGL